MSLLNIDVTSYQHFQIIKTSVFFLCQWTKHFQRTIADRLVRKVYSPEEVLCQPLGKERLFILSKGTIDITANYNQRLQNRRRLVTLRVDPKKDVHFNVYGYSALTSGLSVGL
jgi:hypothetical protein